MNLSFLAQTDAATLKLELAKSAFESAKQSLEEARLGYDEVLGLSESHGMARAKVKKLSEDRVQALVDAGIVNLARLEPRADAPARKSKRGSKLESKDASGAEEMPPMLADGEISEALQN